MPPVEVRQFPQRDEGAGRVSHRTEPETTSDLSHLEGPTGAAQQQADEVTVTDTSHLEPPTGVAKESGPTTTRDRMTVALEEQATKRRSATSPTLQPSGDEPSDAEAETKKRTGARDKSRRVEE